MILYRIYLCTEVSKQAKATRRTWRLYSQEGAREYEFKNSEWIMQTIFLYARAPAPPALQKIPPFILCPTVHPLHARSMVLHRKCILKNFEYHSPSVSLLASWTVLSLVPLVLSLTTRSSRSSINTTFKVQTIHKWVITTNNFTTSAISCINSSITLTRNPCCCSWFGRGIIMPLKMHRLEVSFHQNDTVFDLKPVINSLYLINCLLLCVWLLMVWVRRRLIERSIDSYCISSVIGE